MSSPAVLFKRTHFAPPDVRSAGSASPRFCEPVARAMPPLTGMGERFAPRATWSCIDEPLQRPGRSRSASLPTPVKGQAWRHRLLRTPGMSGVSAPRPSLKLPGCLMSLRLSSSTRQKFCPLDKLHTSVSYLSLLAKTQKERGKPRAEAFPVSARFPYVLFSAYLGLGSGGDHHNCV